MITSLTHTQWYTAEGHDNEPDFTWEELKDKVWKVQWMITTRRKWTYTQHQFENVGIIVTGDLEEDMGSMESWTNTTRTIADLVDMYDEGKEFILRYQPDAERIFRIIQDYTHFVSWKINNEVGINNLRLQNNPNIAEVLNDVIKMQNLGNKLFPFVLQYTDKTPQTSTGLLGFIHRHNGKFGMNSLEFNPFEKFGISKDVYTQENYDDINQTYNVIDVRNSFNPSVFSEIRGVI